MAKFLTPDVVTLLGEFLEDATHSGKNDEVKARWKVRDDIAEAMRPYIEQLDGEPRTDNVWMDEATSLFPEAYFWQLSLFKVCAKRSLRRIDAIQEDCSSIPGFGVF